MEQINNLFHFYETTQSFLFHRKNKLIPLDSICFLKETGQIYTQGHVFGICEEQFCWLKNTVLELQAMLAEDGITDGVLNTLKEVFNFLEGYSESQTLKGILEQMQHKIDGKVDKVLGKGLSTNDFTNEYKEKLEGAMTFKEVLSSQLSTLKGKIGEWVFNKTTRQYLYWDGESWVAPTLQWGDAL